MVAVSTRGLKASPAAVRAIPEARLQALLDEVHGETLAAAQRTPPGIVRVVKAVEAHLDAHLGRSEIRTLFSTLRADESVRRFQHESDGALMQLIRSELESAGIARSEAQTQIVNAMVREIANAEHEKGGALTDFRNALQAHLGSLQA